MAKTTKSRTSANPNPDTLEGSGDPAAPVPAAVIEGDTNTGPVEGDGSTLSDATQGHDQIEVGAATASEPSQGAADDDGSMAGAVHALVIEAGAENVAQLLAFADLGRRIFLAFPDLTTTPPWNINFRDHGAVGTATFLLSEGGAVDESIGDLAARAGTIRVKSTRDGFRRAGLVHSKVGQTFAPGALTEDQFKLLDGDPSITVEYI